MKPGNKVTDLVSGKQGTIECYNGNDLFEVRLGKSQQLWLVDTSQKPRTPTTSLEQDHK